jgi:hypothetical protein
MNSFYIRRLLGFSFILRLTAIVVAATVLAIQGCSEDPVSSKGDDNDDLAERRAQYIQAVAEKVAPLLLFDKEQGWDGDWQCFPMDAGEYWDLRKSGERGRICNEDSSTVTVGGSNLPTGNQVPVYYVYEKCLDERAIGDLNGMPSESGCKLLIPPTIPELSCGSVCVDLIDALIRITYTASADWEIIAADLWLGTDTAEIPRNSGGNPEVRRFENRLSNSGGLDSCFFDIPVTEFDTAVYAAAHATLRKVGTNETISVWGSGLSIGDPGVGATCISIAIDIVRRIEYVMYWVFYGWQDYCSPGSGAHHADWERVVVKIINGSLDRVMFFQHSGWYTRDRGNYEVFGEHPCVYVGKNQHGSYHDDGGTGTCCYWEDFRKPGSWGTSLKLLTWNNLVLLSADDSSPEWMRYGGEWGGDNLNDGVWSPLTQSLSFCDDLCNIPGCRGRETNSCYTSGCYKSDVPYDETM